MINEDPQAKEQTKQDQKNTELLIKSVKELTKSLDIGNKEAKNKPAGSGDGILKQAALGKFGGGLASLKSLTTKEGILDLVASKTGGGLISNILSGSAENIRGKKREQETKAKYITGYLSGTDRGRAAVNKDGEEKATKDAEITYNKKLDLEKQISAVEEKRAVLKASGVEGADISRDDMLKLDDKKDELSYVLSGKGDAVKKVPDNGLPNDAISKTNSMSGAMVNGNTIQSTSVPDKLLSLNEEQLVQLKKLVSASTQTEEDKLEELAREKKSDTGVNPVKESKKSITSGIVEKVTSLIPNILKSGGGLVTGALGALVGGGGKLLARGAGALGRVGLGVGSVIASTAPSLARGALAAGSVVGKTASAIGAALPSLTRGVASTGSVIGKAASGIGKFITGASSPNIISTAPSLLGKISSGAGSIISGGTSLLSKVVPKVGSLLGSGASLIGDAISPLAKAASGVVSSGGSLLSKVAAPIAETVGKGAASIGAKGLGKSLLKKIPGIGLLAGLGFAANRALDGDFTGAALEAASGAAGIIPGIGTAASIGIDASLAARDYNAEKDKSSLSKPMKLDIPTRAMQSETLDNTSADMDKMMNDNKMSTNISAPVTNNVISNSSTTNVLRPNIRTPEPSFNRVLNNNFSN